MVLLHALHRLGFTVVAAHVNFGLRGAESDADEKLVKETCMALGLMCLVKKASKPDILVGESTQMWARQVRYEWFDELRQKNGFSHVATAHHLQDSLETFLLNLARGTGLSGLTGIADQPQVLRPMLEATRQEILDYAEENGVKWREDASNEKTDYARNKIRQQVLPILQSLNPALVETFRDTLVRLKGAEQLVDNHVDAVKQSFFLDEETKKLELTWLTGQAQDVVILWELLKPFGFSFDQVKQMTDQGRSGRRFLSVSHEVQWDRDCLYVKPLGPEGKGELEIQGVGNYSWGHFDIEVSETDTIANDPMIAVVDKGSLDFPVTVGAWREGDWIFPLGLGGKKKVSDCMIDHKIPLTLKPDIPVFRCGDRVVWLGGIRLDDRFKVTPDTREKVRITLHCRDKALQEVLHRQGTSAD